MNFKYALAAAALVGVAGTAQAADLAKKAPAAANYVKVCDAYGAGFFYIPGSDTCLKISGYARFQATVNGPTNNWLATHGWSGTLNAWNRNGNGITTAAKADIVLDARSNTELGLLRSVVEIQADSASYGGINTNLGAAAGGPAAPAVGTSYLATNVYLDKAFVQIGGLTAGRAQSFYDFLSVSAFTLSSTNEPVTDVRVNLLAYTFSFGNGITATLSIEDPSTSANSNPNNSASGARRSPYDATSGSGKYGGVHTPDLIGNIAVSQAWGSAQLSAALHSDDPSVDGRNSQIGWAVQGGVKVNLPALGAGDLIGLQAAYSKGALGYVSTAWQGGSSGTSAAVGNGANTRDFFNDNNSANGIVQSSGYAIYGALLHNWTKTVYTSAGVGYSYFDAPEGNLSAADAASTSDYSFLDVRGTVGWKPVTNLLIAAEVDYGRVDYKVNTAARPDASVVTGFLRIQRSF